MRGCLICAAAVSLSLSGTGFKTVAGGRAAVPKVPRWPFDGRAAEAEALADKAIIAAPRRMPPYQPLGDLSLKFTIRGAVSGYERELDLDTAIARVRFTAGGTTFTRE